VPSLLVVGEPISMSMQASVLLALGKTKSVLQGKEIEVSKTCEPDDMEQEAENAARTIFIGNLDPTCDADDIKVHAHFQRRFSAIRFTFFSG
jgi:pyruvoyl-dependent arginine decarboxylase (PvlArgDC)